MTTKEEALEMVVAKAKAYAGTLEEEQLEPMDFVCTPFGIVAGAHLGRFLSIDKGAAFDAMHDALAMTDALAHAFVSEVWMAVMSKEKGKEFMREEGTIQDLPPDDRLDVLFIFASANGGPAKQLTARIKYDDRGNRYLEEFEEAEAGGADSFSGRAAITSW